MSFFKWLNWCSKREEELLTYIDKKEFTLNFLQELADDTTTDIDDILVDYIKKRLENIKKIDLKE